MDTIREDVAKALRGGRRIVEVEDEYYGVCCEKHAREAMIAGVCVLLIAAIIILSVILGGVR